MKKNILVVVAHPDDEVLGAGATIKRLSDEGHNVYVCILSGKVTARYLKPEQSVLDQNKSQANNLLGVKEVITGEFPNISFNTCKHLELVQFIEKAIENTNATIIVTHHPNDLNNDHYHTSIACQAASRLWQRRDDILPIEKLLYMEVPSATEWALNSSINMFHPNYFIEVGKNNIEQKIKALSMYKDVMRDYPHPRSYEGIMGLAAYRGSQSGLRYAEAFEIAYLNERM